MATSAQLSQWTEHRTICQDLGIGQSTIKHRVISGEVTIPSGTGVTVYKGPGPRSNPQATQDQTVWAVFQPQTPRNAGQDVQTGREAVQRLIGQCPFIDDAAATVQISHDDTFVDPNGTSYRIANPSAQPDVGFWYFELVKVR